MQNKKPYMEDAAGDRGGNIWDQGELEGTLILKRTVWGQNRHHF